tara:strand:+ start:1294 stop:1419 length:126 start_codon:yes stop_codon:yes gene_type:complete
MCEAFSENEEGEQQNEEFHSIFFLEQKNFKHLIYPKKNIHK